MLPLLQYTFPTEARFAADPAFARDVYARLLRRLVGGGTTTALFFATLHPQPCQLQADLVEEAGMRAFVGKVRLGRSGRECICRLLHTISAAVYPGRLL